MTFQEYMERYCAEHDASLTMLQRSVVQLLSEDHDQMVTAHARSGGLTFVFNRYADYYRKEQRGPRS